MTLALYGKSRRRQGGLIGLGLLAVVIALVGALWGARLASAHSIGVTTEPASCDDTEWTVTANTDTWSSYREAVVTAWTGTQPVLDFDRFVYSGGPRQIFTMTGTGPVSGTISMYGGSFGDSGTDTLVHRSNIGASTLTRTTGPWDGSYVAGQIIRIDNELMKITARSANGMVLTVERGHGATNVDSHNSLPFEQASRWLRNDNPAESDNWNLTFDPDDCYTLTVSKSDANDVDPSDWNVEVTINDVLTSAPGSVTVPIATGDSGSIDESWAGAGSPTHEFESLKCWDEGNPGNPFLNYTGNLPFTFTNLINVDNNLECEFTNKPTTFTITAEKVICDTEANLPDWAGTGAVTAERVANFVASKGGACVYDPNWVFEVHPTAGVDERPDDNLQDAANFIDFVGTTTASADGQHRIREQLPPGYVPFAGIQNPVDDVSAEFYCNDDVENYDNLEWVGPGDSYCVGFNAPQTATLRIGKDNADGTRIAGASFLIEHKNAAGAVTGSWCVSDNNAIDPVATIAACASATLLQDTNANDGMVVVTGIPQGATTVTEVQAPAGHGLDVCGGVRNFTLTGTDWSLDATGACQHNTRFQNPVLEGSIVVHKINLGDADDQGDAFTVDVDPNNGGSDPGAQGGLTPANSLTFPNLTPGSYNVIESPVPGYVVTEYLDGRCGAAEPNGQDLQGDEDGIDVTVDAGQETHVCITNQPVGVVRIVKIDQTAAGDTWNLDVSGPENTSTSIVNDGSTDALDSAPYGAYSVTETNANVTFDECSSNTPLLNVFASIANSDNVINEPGEIITFTVLNQDCSAVGGSGVLGIVKFHDVNGNGIRDGGEAGLANWQFTVTGPEFPGGQAFLTDGSGEIALAGIQTGLYQVQETLQSGWRATSLSINGAPQAVSTSAAVAVTLEQVEAVVQFGNRQTGSIEVTKNVVDQVGNATRAGWTFQLTGGCTGVAQSLTTGASGLVVFDNLLPTDTCGVPYLVTESGANSDGFSVSPSATQAVHVNPGEVSEVSFLNSRGGITTFVDPTPTPTNTPEPTATPGPTETVAGEITPGPGDPSPTATDEPAAEATPIAPDAGTGTTSGAGASILLVLMGLAAITMGSGFLALGRKHRS